MRKTIFILCFFLMMANLLKAQDNWYKGNLHTHSYWSDGDEFPEVVMKWYKNNGYDFVALSDHNIIAEGEKWKKIPDDPLYQEAFLDYLESFGKDWVRFRTDSTGTYVKLKTLKEFRPLYEEEGKFMILRAQEVTAYLDKKAVHMGAVNLPQRIEPEKGATIVELIQNNLNAIRKQAEVTETPILQHLNHPNFTYAIKAKDIIQLEGERFFEVFNGHPYVNNYGDSIHDSTEEMWDEVNFAYAQAGKPLIYGLATDDSHHYHKFGSKFSNAGRGWVVVQSEELSPTAIIKNLQAGNFYSSTGVEMSEVRFENNVLHLEVKPEEGVKYTIEFIGTKKGKGGSEVLKSVEGPEAHFELDRDLLFVRAKVISSKKKRNPYKKGDVEVAWIQPQVYKE